MSSFWLNQVKKDFLVDFSYKITFFGGFFGIFLTVISFFFISEIFVGSKSSHLEKFDNDYFIFATLGIAILDMVASIMRSLTASLREAQTFGYIEMFFISRISPIYLFLCCSIYPFIKSSFRFIVYILLVQLVSDHIFLAFSVLTAFFLILLMIIPFLALSFLALSFVLYFKQANPINFLINILISIFSGIMYPVSVLPGFMQSISNLIPLTSQLNSVRHVLINNSLNEYMFSNLFLMHIFFSMMFLCLCLVIFQISIQSVKKRGTIGTY